MGKQWLQTAAAGIQNNLDIKSLIVLDFATQEHSNMTFSVGYPANSIT